MLNPQPENPIVTEIEFQYPGEACIQVIHNRVLIQSRNLSLCDLSWMQKFPLH